MLSPRQKDESPSAASRVIRLVVALGGAGLIAFLFMRAPTDPRGGQVDETVAEVESKPQLPPRCVSHGAPDGVRIGKVKASDEEDFVPFAAEVGRGVALGDGFAVGVKHQIEGVMHAAVALIDGEAKKVELHNLGKVRGDVDAPLVAAQGDGWVAAVLEPNASGMSVRLLRVRGDELMWGAEIEQGRDESLAYDVAFGSEVGVVTWDDAVGKKNDRGAVMVATVTVDSLEGGEDARELSSEAVDAEQPKVVPRPGGFWLAYVARDRTHSKREPDAGADGDDRFRAERIEPSWLELVPLDARGAPETQPLPITDKDGFVLAFDLEPAGEGHALITWRDDDAPSGAHGGRVTSLLVTASGAGQEQTITDDDVGAGVPSLLGGWVAVPNREEEIQLAPMRADGEILSELRIEPLLQGGQLITSNKGVILVAKPAGEAIRLITVLCTRDP